MGYLEKFEVPCGAGMHRHLEKFQGWNFSRFPIGNPMLERQEMN